MNNVSNSCRLYLLVLTLVAFILPLPTHAEEPVELAHARPQLEEGWRARIQSFLDRGMVPLVGMLSFFPRENGDAVVRMTNRVMDEEGVALLCLGGYKASEEGGRGYRWGYFIHEVVNAHPDRYVLGTNKGGNSNWWQQKAGKSRHFIDQLEAHVRGGDYPFISQVEFRHYMSNAQCKRGRHDRDIDIPINGSNGHRLFQLSSETGVPFAIHLEPEDRPIDALEEMLAQYPKAKVIWTHFGQIRHPDKQQRFGPALVERLLKTYPNLYFDISTGEPNRRYQCGEHVLDTVIWESDNGGQRDVLKPAYKAILTNHSDRFVTGLDYGPANRQSADFFRRRVANIRLIIRDLPDAAKHNIGYRNAWSLLTGRAWQ